MRGPPPKPTVLKILEGNRGGKRLNRNEPQPKAGVPNPPTWLDAEARAEWKRIVGALPDGMLTLVDRGILTACCVWWSKFVAATRNDATTTMKEASLEYRQCVAKLGLSPADRSRIQMPLRSDPKSKMDKLLDGRKKSNGPA